VSVLKGRAGVQAAAAMTMDKAAILLIICNNPR
jgi:hypothetical protein